MRANDHALLAKHYAELAAKTLDDAMYAFEQTVVSAVAQDAIDHLGRALAEARAADALTRGVVL